MANADDISGKVRRYLDEKEKLNKKDAYFICKQLTEDYWSEISSEDDEEAIEEDEFDEFEEGEGESGENQEGYENQEGDEEEGIDTGSAKKPIVAGPKFQKPPMKMQKKKIIIKK